ncbi:o-succinylbenzoate synthase [Adhaeribacter rhizoryzae]|uniref:O-succinylbenzoate synthase n=1 Tax=Adhaeribacter rhizoryzae TaxID=2607907 RepID=A0A5M6D174_9BACT|nr:o-succinylbenzoate synthase [Adhaeribacter rhizoryzae]KAA5539379.1 o-succinylbenzoate synthase [Adhaeribacter rhizoryzae]
MSLKLEVIPHTLNFKFDARTSRGAMQQHQVYYFKLYNTRQKEIFGLGECAPLPGLSLEHHPDFRKQVFRQIEYLNRNIQEVDLPDLKSIIYNSDLKSFPSVVFGLESAWRDLLAGGKRILFNNAFTQQKNGIPINGLIWMGDKHFMQEQIKKKLQEGYACLKLKIGGLDFNTELEILKAIRKVAGAEHLTIRVDANGAFSPAEALPKLEKLAAFNLHSIEQPIRAGQAAEMQRLCKVTPVPIALDEELIGVTGIDQKEILLREIAPAYIILKPTLLGGLQATEEWINIASQLGIDWWITSALESNIGLNAISQFTAQYPVTREQGLGTGQLYHNNISSPLSIKQGKLYYEREKKWDLDLFRK